MFVICLGFVLAACSNDTIDTYQGNDNVYYTWSVEGLYVNRLYVYPDSLGFTFAYKEAAVTDSIFKLPVTVQGQVLDRDRTLKVSVNPQSTAKEGVHFDLPESIKFGANLTTDSIPITFHRTPEMKSETFTLVLDLEENEDFRIEMKDKLEDEFTGEMRSYTSFKLSVNDILKQPTFWHEGFLGVFTKKKLFLISELLGIPTDHYNNIVPYSDLQFHAQFMKRYLNDKKAAGETVYEDDGTEMTMGIYA